MLADPELEHQVSAGDGRIGRIPVRNLWLLMLYASDLFRTGALGRVGVEDNPDDLPDLIAEVLSDAVEKRQRRRLSLGYRTKRDVLNRVRGRIDVLTTERRQLLARGLVACTFEDMTIDTPRNRFVRAALEKIAGLVTRRDLSRRCRSLANGMKAMGVSGLTPTRAEISADRFGRHDADDQVMVAAAKLAIDLALPMETLGSDKLPLPSREEAWVRGLFERAIGGFYDVVLGPRGWRVTRGGWLNWQIAEKTAGIDDILPSMQTDIVLDHVASGRRIVIDTKFTSVLTKGWRRDQTLRSGYLYQIYAYLRSQVGRGDPLADSASGLLLHPSIGETVDEAVVVQGHDLRFATVDLTGTTGEIRTQLLRLIHARFEKPAQSAIAGKSLRLVAWNCLRHFDHKTDALLGLDPDVAILSEVTTEVLSAMSNASVVWTEPLAGQSALRAAIVGRNGWQVEKLQEAADRHVMAARVSKADTSFTVIAVWMLSDRGDFVLPLGRALADLETHLSGDVVIAGDFNAHPRWDTGKGPSRRFATIIDHLGDRGIVSLWHHHHGERHGQERTPTFFMNHKAEKPFHIDYVFASTALAQQTRSVAIGGYTDWVASKRSDHAPLIVDIALKT